MMPVASSFCLAAIVGPGQPIGQDAQRILRADGSDPLHREREQRAAAATRRPARARAACRARRPAPRRTTPSAAGSDRWRPRRARAAPRRRPSASPPAIALERARQIQPHQRRRILPRHRRELAERRRPRAARPSASSCTAQPRTYSLSWPSSSSRSCSVSPSGRRAAPTARAACGSRRGCRAGCA